jgi:hypothetical protein
MSAVQLEIPEETLISLKTDVETFGRDLKMLAAVKLFELGKLSSGRAAQLGQPDASGVPPRFASFSGFSLSGDGGGAEAGHSQCLAGWSSATHLLFCIYTKSVISTCSGDFTAGSRFLWP